MTADLLEALPFAVYVVDARTRATRLNQRAARLSASLSADGELPEAVRKTVADAIASGRDLVGEDLRRAVEIAPPGPQTLAAPSYVPQVMRIGAEPAWVVVLSEVTQLRQHDAAKTKAMSTLGHEVKTPVTSIRMVLHLLLEEKVGPLTADQRELVTAGYEDCERLLTVLQGLLELARLEGGRVALKIKPVPAEELVASLGMASDPRGSELPNVRAESASVLRILKNFGAVKLAAMEAEKPATLRVEPRTGAAVRFVVRRDLRRGLTEAERLRVFEAFAVKAESDPEQSGLGLAIARELAVLQGGSVGVGGDDRTLELFLDLPTDGPSEVAAAE